MYVIYVPLGKLFSPPHLRKIKSGDSPCPQRTRLPALLAAHCWPPRSSAACGQSQQGGFHGFPPAEVTTFVVEPKAIPATYEYVGQTTGSKEVEVRARVTGILEQKLFAEGAPVKAGQVLFVIDPKPLAAQAAALEADVTRAQAQRRRRTARSRA